MSRPLRMFPITPTPPPRRRSTKALPAPTPSEARFEALLRGAGAVPVRPAAPVVAEAKPAADAAAPMSPDPVDDAAAFVRELYAHRDEYLDRDPYATIGAADEFNTKVVGVSFEGRQDLIAGLAPGSALELERQPQNEKDPNAIAVRYGALQIGYIRAQIAKRLAPNIDAGERYGARITDLTGGTGDRNWGVNIRVTRLRPLAPVRTQTASGAAFDEPALVRALIGDRPVRESQGAVLERVASGVNALAVLGTGRGKSFCYQLPAAREALTRRRKTLVLYPLRALANDQFEALTRKLGATGLRILRANGAIGGDERAELNAALDDGSWDLILSTPEFVQFHGESFRRPVNRPALLVIDEAHHVHDSRHRPAYAALGAFIDSLEQPQVLALTATAGEGAFETIRQLLKIDAWVIDPFIRENLHLQDARNVSDKNAYLRKALAGDSKAIVYCNSRAEATKVAEALSSAFRSEDVAFYHAGMAHDARIGVENYFRSGGIRVVVATSAFGEGIDLPDVRDVVLYHLNFNFTEFNQQAGRAGRDGSDARIHLIYGERDRSLNEYIIARTNPPIETLRTIYRSMRGLSSDDYIRLSYDDIARTLDIDRVTAETIGASISIFEEAGLVQTGSDEDGRFVRFREVAEKVDLTKTARFAEGVAERDAFEAFCSLALGAAVDVLERVINRPIYPARVALRA